MGDNGTDERKLEIKLRGRDALCEPAERDAALHSVSEELLS